MNLKYLQDLLYDAKRLNLNQVREAEDLKIKVVDALKELGLFDVNTVNIGFLRFSSPYEHLKSEEFSTSKQRLISTLESKIAVYEGRINRSLLAKQLASAKAAKSEELAVNRWMEVANGWEQLANDKDTYIQTLESDIAELNGIIDSLHSDKASLSKKVTKSKRIWNLYSLGFWALVVGAFVGMSVWMYDLGKDNGKSKYDSEKNELAKAVDRRDSTIVKKNFQIDSLKKLIPKSSPVN